MADYRIAEPFDVDNGALNALPREECFALGVEWAMMRARLLAGEQFNDLCMAPNAERIAAMAERHGRFVEHHDYGDGWSQIFIGAPRASS